MEADEASGHVPFVECTECRSPKRDRYYVLNERPVCAKCRTKYDQMIRHRDGRFAMGRVAFHGGLVALAGAIALAVIETVFPAARIFVLVPIGYLLGKRIMSSVDHYSARRYQYLAVALTYVTFMIGMAVPAIREADERQITHEANDRAAMQRDLAEFSAELSASSGQTASAQAAGGAENNSATPTGEAASDTGSDAGILNALLLVLFLPILRMLQFGMNFGAVSILALGVGLFQAWKQTDGQGAHFTLRGPFRVGHGPIAAR